jgi:hypothetical protein
MFGVSCVLIWMLPYWGIRVAQREQAAEIGRNILSIIAATERRRISI